MTKSEKVPILGIFSPKTILMFRVGLKRIRVGRSTGTTHTFHLSLTQNSSPAFGNIAVLTEKTKLTKAWYLHANCHLLDLKLIHYCKMSLSSD